MEEATARYKRHWEKLREEKDTREVEKKDLQSRLNETLSYVEAAFAKAEAEATAGVEKTTKAKELGHQRGREAGMEFPRKVLVTLALISKRTVTLRPTFATRRSACGLRLKAGIQRRWSLSHLLVRATRISEPQPWMREVGTPNNGCSTTEGKPNVVIFYFFPCRIVPCWPVDFSLVLILFHSINERCFLAVVLLPSVLCLLYLLFHFTFVFLGPYSKG